MPPLAIVHLWVHGSFDDACRVRWHLHRVCMFGCVHVHVNVGVSVGVCASVAILDQIKQVPRLLLGGFVWLVAAIACMPLWFRLWAWRLDLVRSVLLVLRGCGSSPAPGSEPFVVSCKGRGRACVCYPAVCTQWCALCRRGLDQQVCSWARRARYGIKQVCACVHVCVHRI